MPYGFLVWLIATLIQAAHLGISMHVTMLFTDLENDAINLHDATASINAVVYWCYGLEVALAIWVLLHGSWVLFLLPAGLAVRHFMLWQHRRHLVDVTEIYREIKPRRNQALVQLVVSLVCFIWVIYCLLWIILHGMLSPEGKEAAQQLLQETAASIY